jgi:hypothetical protein
VQVADLKQELGLVLGACGPNGRCSWTGHGRTWSLLESESTPVNVNVGEGSVMCDAWCGVFRNMQLL